MDVIALLVALLVILAGAELFTNGIEWFGRKLQLAEGAVGSVLAAVGTALPETMIPVIAFLFGTGAAAEAVGIGAILGAPFMLATLAMFVTGLAIVIGAPKRPAGDLALVDLGVLRQDVLTFGVAYGLAIGVAFLPSDLVLPRYAAAAVLVAIYAWYVKRHFEADPDVDADDLAPLRLRRLDRRAHRADPHIPRLRVVNLQVAVALGLIVVGAYAFVGAVEHIATAFAVSPMILALVIAPVATELPEKFNSVIWVRQRKDTLALGNISGAMVFQSCIPTVVALLAVPSAWSTQGSGLPFASAAIALLATAAIFGPAFRAGRLRGRWLLMGGAFYIVYITLVVVSVTQGGT